MGSIGVLVTFILGAWCNWWQLAAAMMVSEHTLSVLTQRSTARTKYRQY